MEAFKKLVWPELETTWDRGRLHVKGYARGKFEDNIEYFQRVANHYTKQHGIETRDDWLVHRYREGQSSSSLATDFGLTVGAVKQILKKHNVIMRGLSCIPNPVRDAEIYRRRCAGEKFISIGASFGITGHRVSQIFRKIDRRVQGAIWRATRKPPKSRIVEPSPDILDTWLVSETWTPEMQAMEFERHRGIDIT
jgi:hypothetical protein